MELVGLIMVRYCTRTVWTRYLSAAWPNRETTNGGQDTHTTGRRERPRRERRNNLIPQWTSMLHYVLDESLSTVQFNQYILYDYTHTQPKLSVHSLGMYCDTAQSELSQTLASSQGPAQSKPTGLSARAIAIFLLPRTHMLYSVHILLSGMCVKRAS